VLSPEFPEEILETIMFATLCVEKTCRDIVNFFPSLGLKEFVLIPLFS
jgi:hypothetical protein